MGNCNHCWHRTGNRLLMDTPKDEEKCCWCGRVRYTGEWSSQCRENHGDRLNEVPQHKGDLLNG
jgi:hypothetical protein